MSIPRAIAEAIEQLQRLTDLFTHRREQLAAEVGLTVAQWRLLEEISGEHFMPSMFARQQESTPATISKLIRQLLDKGVITVSVSETDGRQRRYALTKAGHELMVQLRESRRRAIAAIWSGFSGEELSAFSDFSVRLSAQLEAYAAHTKDLTQQNADEAVTIQ